MRLPGLSKREISRYFEGKLIKGRSNAFAMGNLAMFHSGYLILAQMDDATAKSAVKGFSTASKQMSMAQDLPSWS